MILTNMVATGDVYPSILLDKIYREYLNIEPIKPPKPTYMTFNMTYAIAFVFSVSSSISWIWTGPES